MSSDALENLGHEERRFAPSEVFVAGANVSGADYVEADGDRLGFWAARARELEWVVPFTEVLDWSGAPFARWFVGGSLNVAVNCLIFDW